MKKVKKLIQWKFLIEKVHVYQNLDFKLKIKNMLKKKSIFRFPSFSALFMAFKSLNCLLLGFVDHALCVVFLNWVEKLWSVGLFNGFYLSSLMEAYNGKLGRQPWTLFLKSNPRNSPHCISRLVIRLSISNMKTETNK